MFGKGNGFIGGSGFFLKTAENPSEVPLLAFWLFQAAFCGAAATIVAGSMAERIKFPAYIIYSFLVLPLCIPLSGTGYGVGVGFRQSVFQTLPDRR